MTGKVLPLENIISADLLATRLTEKYVQWETLRQVKKNEWEEVRRYVYATDTSETTNSRLPWKNRTTIPKICQIRDNLYSNYTATLFPKRKWLEWEANDKDSNSVAKRDSIVNYMTWCVEQPTFKHEMDKLIMDYIDFGNCFGTVEWSDHRVLLPDGRTQVGFVGPSIRRIRPIDIVFNPTAEDFMSSPKIIRSIVSMGELREMMQRMTNDENREEYEKLFEYLKDIRFHARTFESADYWVQLDHLYQMDGFTSFRAYLMSDFIEVLTFYGDWYDYYTNTFEKNRVITVVDRHKLINDKPNPSFFGYPPIFNAVWRKKQDNLWGMGPLDNLIGMQYRLDHIENMRADVVDLTTFPVQKIKGFVEDYVWQPGEKIFIGDEGDVELIAPDVQLVNANFDLQRYVSTMEEMAGAPKEAMGFRSPGEKTAYEVQRLENAASRIYQNKINQFSEFTENLMNGMLEMARRQMSEATSIRVFDDDLKIATFQTLTVEDITGVGRIKPVAARHFAEQAELIQNLTNLTSSGLWQTVQPHFSGIKLAKIVEKIFNLQDEEVVMPNVALTEQAQAQMQMRALQETMVKQAGVATGQGQDFDLDQAHSMPQAKGTPFNLKREPPASAEPGGMLGTQ